MWWKNYEPQRVNATVGPYSQSEVVFDKLFLENECLQAVSYEPLKKRFDQIKSNNRTADFGERPRAFVKDKERIRAENSYH